MRIGVNFDWLGPLSDIAYESTGGREGRLFLANEFKRLMYKYVPKKNMVLSQNVSVYVDEDGEGVVKYNSPYAHYQYEGEVYGPNIPKKDANGNVIGWWSPPHKTPTGRKLQYDKFRNPLATDHWDRAMLKDKKQDLIRAYQAWLETRASRDE